MEPRPMFMGSRARCYGNETHTLLSCLMSSLSDKHSWKEEEEEEVVARVGSEVLPC